MSHGNLLGFFLMFSNKILLNFTFQWFFFLLVKQIHMKGTLENTHIWYEIKKIV